MAVRILNLFMICFPDKHKYSTLVTRDIVCHLCNKELRNEVNMRSFSTLNEMGGRVR